MANASPPGVPEAIAGAFTEIFSFLFFPEPFVVLLNSICAEDWLPTSMNRAIGDVTVLCNKLDLGMPILGYGTSGGTVGNRPYDGTAQAAIEDAKEDIIKECPGIISSLFEVLSSKCEPTTKGGYRVIICRSTVRGYCK